jgi:hypothetical protein
LCHQPRPLITSHLAVAPPALDMTAAAMTPVRNDRRSCALAAAAALGASVCLGWHACAADPSQRRHGIHG